jgi:hypothetical protein
MPKKNSGIRAIALLGIRLSLPKFPVKITHTNCDAFTQGALIMATLPNGDFDHPPTDEGDFDRPRPHKKGNGALFVVIGLSLLLIGGVIFAVFYFLSDRSKIDSEMLAFLPAGTNIMAGVEVEDLMKNEKIKNVVLKVLQGEGKDFYAKLKEAGLSENDFSRILVGGVVRPRNRDEEATVIVVRAKKSFDKGKIAAVMGLTEQNKNGKSYFKPAKGEMFLYFPADTLAVFAQSEKAIEEIASRETGKVVVSEEMQDLGKKLSKGQIWVAVGKSAIAEQLKSLDQVKNNPVVPNEVLEIAKGVGGVGGFIKLDGDHLTLTVGVLCASSDDASKAASNMQKSFDALRQQDLSGLLAMLGGGGKKDDIPADARTLITDVQKSLKADHSGALVEISAGCSVSGLVNLLETAVLFLGAARQDAADVQIQRAREEVPRDRNLPDLTPPVKDRVKPFDPKDFKGPEPRKNESKEPTSKK